MDFENSSTRSRLRGYGSPALVTLAILVLVIGFLLAANNGNPMKLVNTGTHFSLGLPGGTIGYDGQFYYYIAVDPNPVTVAPHLDVPAYRYQRILFPLLVNIFSLGNQNLVPWLMILLGIIFQTLGTVVVSRILETRGINRWYALVYGLWPGFLFAVIAVMPETLAFGLVAGAVLANQRGHKHLSWLLYGLSLFAKEVTVGFLLAVGLNMIYKKRWRDLATFVLMAGLPYLVFQAWLWRTFGSFGLASGGAYATSFEIIPFMGIVKLFLDPSLLLKAWGLLLIPLVAVPVIWAIWVSGKRLVQKTINYEGLGLFINAALLVILPYSTYVDVRGVGRFLCGFILALILFLSQDQESHLP